MKTKMTTRRLTACALFAGITAVCSQIIIPMPMMVPISFSLFAVYLSGGLLGAATGALSQVVYILLGSVGLPIFSGFQAGAGVLLGPTGGYLWGYILAAWIVGYLTQKFGSGFWQLVAAMIAGLAACYTLGTIWFVVLTGKGLIVALAACVLPFLPGDAIKIALAALLVKRLQAPFARLGGQPNNVRK